MKTAILFALTLIVPLTVAAAKTAPTPPDFSGQWVLDSGQSKSLPDGLESYTMRVNQDAQQLKVETTLKGNLRPAERPDSGSPGGYPGGVGNPGGSVGGGGIGSIGLPRSSGQRPMGEGMPGGGNPGATMPGGGMPGGGSPRAQSRSEAGVAALELFPHSAVFQFGGADTTAQLGDSDQTSAKLKAEWAGGGKSLKLSAAASPSAGKVELKEQWKLSKDGQLLYVDRAVHAPNASGTVHLVFRKQAAEPDAGKGSSQ